MYDSADVIRAIMFACKTLGKQVTQKEAASLFYKWLKSPAS